MASLGFGGATLLLGLVVIVGWYTGSRTLIQVLPQFVPMQYNTALGFVLSGAALLLLIRERGRGAVALGALAALIGALTLVEYVAQVDLREDSSLPDWLPAPAGRPRTARRAKRRWGSLGAASVGASRRGRIPRARRLRPADE